MTTTLLNQLMLQPNALKLCPLRYSYLNSRAYKFVLSMATYNVSLGFLFTLVMLEHRLKIYNRAVLKILLGPPQMSKWSWWGAGYKPPL